MPGENSGWYLPEGGSATRVAEKGVIFIVRADGKVTSYHQGGWRCGSVLSTAAHPGDAVVVPGRPVIGDTRWKNFMALAQIDAAGAITAAILP